MIDFENKIVNKFSININEIIHLHRNVVKEILIHEEYNYKSSLHVQRKLLDNEIIYLKRKVVKEILIHRIQTINLV